ncbi:unnamed protein product [Closterium sp. NIES-64]|nr:unnamed protein product [Closterium sp. NIES-64]
MIHPLTPSLLHSLPRSPPSLFHSLHLIPSLLPLSPPQSLPSYTLSPTHSLFQPPMALPESLQDPIASAVTLTETGCALCVAPPGLLQAHSEDYEISEDWENFEDYEDSQKMPPGLMQVLPLGLLLEACSEDVENTPLVFPPEMLVLPPVPPQDKAAYPEKENPQTGERLRCVAFVLPQFGDSRDMPLVLAPVSVLCTPAFLLKRERKLKYAWVRKGRVREWIGGGERRVAEEGLTFESAQRRRVRVNEIRGGER